MSHISHNASTDAAFSVVKAGDLENTIKLVDKEGLNIRDSYDQTPLHIAAFCGHIALVQVLVSKGSNPNAVDKNGYTPLLAAASSSERTTNHVIVCELLLRRGAKPNFITTAGTSILHYLVRFPPSSDLTILLKLLVEMGTDIDIRDANEETPLLQAAFRGNEATVQFLILHGAGLDNTNKMGETALHMAARAGKTNIVRELLNNDADPYVESQNGTPKDIAFLCNHQEIVDIFETYEKEAIEYSNLFNTSSSTNANNSSPSSSSSSSSPSSSSTSSNNTSLSFKPSSSTDNSSVSSADQSASSSPNTTPSPADAVARTETVKLEARPSRFGTLSATFSMDFGEPSSPHSSSSSTSTSSVRRATKPNKLPPSFQIDPRLLQLNVSVEQSDASTIYGLRLSEEESTAQHKPRLTRQSSVVAQASGRIILSHPLFNLELGSRSLETAKRANSQTEALNCIPSDISLEYSDEHDSFWYTQEFIKPGVRAIEPVKRKCLLNEEDFRPHINLFATLDASRIILSILLEPNSSGDFRGILRRATGERLFFLSSRELTVKPGHKKFFPQLFELLDAKLPGITCINLVEDVGFRRSLVELELILKIQKYKFGVVCIRDHMDEEAVFSHNDYPPAYKDFLNFLGPEIELLGWPNYRGDLDVKNGGTGTHAHHTFFSGMEIIFQSASNLPEIRRKPIIGNTISTIVFLESGLFDPSLIVSQVLHVFLVVQPVPSPNPKYPVYYRVGIVSKKGVPRYRPSLLLPAVFPPTPEFRHFLLTKLINGERASYHCFSKTASQRRSLVEIVQQTRLGQLEFAISNLAPTAITPRELKEKDRKGTLSISGIIRRKKEKKLAKAAQSSDI